MSRRSLPYFFLAVLVLCVLLAAAVRYGAYIQAQSQKNEYVAKIITQLTSSPLPTPPGPTIKHFTHGVCHLDYLAYSDSSVEFICDDETITATNAAQLLSGFTQAKVGTVSAFFKTNNPAEIELILRTIKLL